MGVRHLTDDDLKQQASYILDKQMEPCSQVHQNTCGCIHKLLLLYRM